MFQFQSHMLPQPCFLALAAILYLVPPVTIPDYHRNCLGDYLIQIMPNLCLLPGICYVAETLSHHTDHLGVLFDTPAFPSFC